MANWFYKQGANAASSALGIGASAALGAGLGPYMNPSPEGATPEEKRQHDHDMRVRYGLMSGAAASTGALGDHLIGSPLGQHLYPNSELKRNLVSAGTNMTSSMPGWWLSGYAHDKLKGPHDTDD